MLIMKHAWPFRCNHTNENRERIVTSQGPGIRNPERGLGPLCSLVVVA